MSISGANRVRRGVSRIGLIGLIPAVLISAAFATKELWRPSGLMTFNYRAIDQLANVPSPALLPYGETPWFKYSQVNTYETERTLKQSLAANGQDFHLIDGRVIRAAIAQGETRSRAEIETSVNRSIIAYEMQRQYPLNSYSGPYYAGTVLLNCPEYGDCSAPFPNRSKAHIDRKMDFTGPGLGILFGIVWYGLFWLIGWIITGFMKE